MHPKESKTCFRNRQSRIPKMLSLASSSFAMLPFFLGLQTQDKEKFFFQQAQGYKVFQRSFGFPTVRTMMSVCLFFGNLNNNGEVFSQTSCSPFHFRSYDISSEKNDRNNKLQPGFMFDAKTNTIRHKQM